ncbi:MAG: glucose-1-phosphate cytidylyltransferase [Acidobacteriia bacterium]|nr:glucose-1-phosphate cytidylyltransferase [Terriglobia bacterium]
MKTVILAGGQGTRLAEETDVRPKPMVEIGGRPILWHIMKIYASRGHNEFVLALGYKGDAIKSYFLNYHRLQRDVSVHLATGSIDMHDGECEDWLVHLTDTGIATDTGGRLRRLTKHIGGETFMMTYGDGVADLDVNRVIEFHRRHGRLATVTAVRPPSRFGGLTAEGDSVKAFSEKPQIEAGWINGGFFVLEPRVLDYISGDDTKFEREPLETLAREGQLMMYRHEGFWHCMDTVRDLRQLHQMWDSGEAPWRIWR